MSLRNRLVLKQIIFKNVYELSRNVKVKITKYVDFIVVCVEFTKMGL